MNKVISEATPTIAGAGGFTLLQTITQPDQMQHTLGIIITVFTGVVQLISLFKKKKS